MNEILIFQPAHTHTHARGNTHTQKLKNCHSAVTWQSFQQLWIVARGEICALQRYYTAYSGTGPRIPRQKLLSWIA